MGKNHIAVTYSNMIFFLGLLEARPLMTIIASSSSFPDWHGIS
jgi:hypothetical protein